jgi:hypothetical protein
MERTCVRVHTRKIDRNVAKVKMKKLGICGMSKEDWKPRSPRETKYGDICGYKPEHYRSYFANNWKEFSNN